MTLTDSRPEAVEIDYAAIAKAVAREIQVATESPNTAAVRELLNQVGIRQARVALTSSVTRYAEAQDAYRAAQAAERLAKDAHDDAALEAEWSAPTELRQDGNKTYRWAPCDECDGTHRVPETGEGRDGFTKCGRCGVSGKRQVFMLADEVKRWKAQEVAKAPALLPLKAALRQAEEATATARDAVTLAERRLQAARHDLDACVVELQVAALAIPKGA